MFLICLFFFFYYFIEGRRHEAAILADSNLLQDMQRYAFSREPAGHLLLCLWRPRLPIMGAPPDLF